MRVLDLRCDVLHVVAGICVRRDLDLLAEELPVADRHGFPEALHLRAAVLDVVLAMNIGTGELEDGREHVAERPATRVRERERTGGIRGHELDLDALAFQVDERP
jgi:hypothetical protein